MFVKMNENRSTVFNDWDQLKYDGHLYYICEKGHRVVSSEPLNSCPVYYEGTVSRTKCCGASFDWVLVDFEHVKNLVGEVNQK